MDNKLVGGWVRQARYRARKHGISSDLTSEDAAQIIAEHQESCAYCGGSGETLDHLFPLKDAAPNCPANVVVTCKQCKKAKGNNDLVWMFARDHITRARYLALLQLIVGRRGGTEVKELLKKATGI